MSRLHEQPTDVLVEGDFAIADTKALLNAAQAAVLALAGRRRVARFNFRGRTYRAKVTWRRLLLLTDDNQRILAYRWKD